MKKVHDWSHPRCYGASEDGVSAPDGTSTVVTGKRIDVDREEPGPGIPVADTRQRSRLMDNADMTHRCDRLLARLHDDVLNRVQLADLASRQSSQEETGA